jgi:hypothetical protein
VRRGISFAGRDRGRRFYNGRTIHSFDHRFSTQENRFWCSGRLPSNGTALSEYGSFSPFQPCAAHVWLAFKFGPSGRDFRNLTDFFRCAPRFGRS